MNGMEQQIQAAAEKLFLHYGFRKTSVDQIAREAGIGKGTIYNYFRNYVKYISVKIDQRE